MPKVSIIIPNYNHATFLAQRIESILTQTFQDFEVIILDDCSKDNSKEIIEYYRLNEKVTQIIVNESNSGSTFKQWEKGIALAKGNYIWIAESDDWADETLLDTLIAVMIKNPQIGIAYCDSMEVDQYGEAIGRWSRWQENFNENIWKASFVKSGLELNQHYHNLYNVIPNASSVLFKKELYDQSVFLKKVRRLKYVGDWYIWFSIFMYTDVYYHHQTLNYFRCHQNTTRSKNNGNMQKIMEYYGAIKDFNQFPRIKHPKELLEKRLGEIFKMWQLGARSLLKINVILSLPKIYTVDRRIFKRIFFHIILPKLKQKKDC